MFLPTLFRELPTFVLRSHQNAGGQLQKLSLELNEKSNVRLGILNIVKGKASFKFQMKITGISRNSNIEDAE